jgi:regulatory protein
MIINRIVKKGKKDVTIHFDDDKFLILALEVFLKSGLKKGDELFDDRYSALIEENKLFHLKQKAFRLLGRRQHATSELRRKLWQRDYEQKLIDKVVDDLSKSAYLNDSEFISEFVAEKSKTKKWSSNKIKSELLRKGIDQKLIELSFEQIPKSDEFENAFSLGQKKYNTLIKRTEDKRELKQKLSTYLYSKGFDYDLIREVCSQIIKDNLD